MAALLAVALAQAQTVQYIYDNLGRLSAVIDATGRTTLYTYDAAGNILSITRNETGQLAISVFNPDHGKVGDAVTIFGSGFIPGAGNNTVSFNGTAATVTAATATRISTTVPVGATSGLISVSNANGNATSTNAFTVVAAPVITGVTPNAIGQGMVTRVEIGGSNLAFATSVTFSQAGILATVLPGATNTILQANVSVAANVPPGAYAFSVANSAGTTNSGSVTVNVGVRPTGQSITVARPLSVFVPQSQTAPTPGTSMSITKPVSVFVPRTQAAPTPGTSMSVSPPVSVSMP